MTVSNRKNRKYTVVPYHPSWVEDFAKIKAELALVFGDLAQDIEHVGSTAIQGMCGKATIDVLVIVKSIAAVDALNARMECLGFQALGDYIEQGGRLFIQEEDGERLVNVHCAEAGNSHIQEMLVMRDFLRSNADEAQAYANLKQELFEKYPEDYIAYRAVKDPYLQKLKERAMAWGAKQR